MPRKVFSWVEVDYKKMIDDKVDDLEYNAKGKKYHMDNQMLLPYINGGMLALTPGIVYKITKPVFIFREHYAGKWVSSEILRVFVDNQNTFNHAVELYNTQCNGCNHGEVMFPICPGYATNAAVYLCIDVTHPNSSESGVEQGVYAIPIVQNTIKNSIVETNKNISVSAMKITTGTKVLSALKTIFK